MFAQHAPICDTNLGAFWVISSAIKTKISILNSFQAKLGIYLNFRASNLLLYFYHGNFVRKTSWSCEHTKLCRSFSLYCSRINKVRLLHFIYSFLSFLHYLYIQLQYSTHFIKVLCKIPMVVSKNWFIEKLMRLSVYSTI